MKEKNKTEKKPMWSRHKIWWRDDTFLMYRYYISGGIWEYTKENEK